MILSNNCQPSLPSYYPLVWARTPERQIIGFDLLLLLNITTFVLLVRELWRLRRRVNALTQAQVLSPSEQRPLVRMRRRRRQTTDQVV